MSSPPVPQGRHSQLEHTESVVEILTEFLFFDVGLQILIRGRQHTDVNLHLGGRTNRQERMAFENSQQFGLAIQRQLADFVQKQRPQVTLLEVAFMVVVGHR